jgi:hypothetical protein
MFPATLDVLGDADVARSAAGAAVGLCAMESIIGQQDQRLAKTTGG